MPITGTSSYYYNCHGFAWYFCGNTSGITNARAVWLFSLAVPQYINHSCYSRVNSIPDTVLPGQLVQYKYRKYLQPGYVIVYKRQDNDETNRHSAVITSVSSSGIYVRSKWGEYEIFDHKVDDCPYLTGQNLSGGFYNLTVAVYQPSHYTSDNSLLPNYSGGYYVFPRYITYTQKKHKTLCDCGRTRQTQFHTFTQLNPNTWQCQQCGYTTNSISLNSYCIYGIIKKLGE